MRKHAETSHANKGYKLAIVVFIPICCFHNRHLWYLLKKFFARKRSLAHSYFFSEKSHFNIVFHLTSGKWRRFYSGQ